MANRVGEQLDDYRLIRLLGAGTFGEVYLGEHVYQRMRVAVKVLNIHLTPDTLKDFLNEARIVRLKHPHIMQIVDFGISGDTPFLVMDYAPNGTLRQRHPQGTILPLQRILPYVRQVADALQYAHDMRLIHRDVKPQNMLLGSNDQVLLSDFGIAVVAHTERSLTTQEMAGTVPYMAPEQIRGKPRPASDQYALGIVVYEWLCGARPFRGSQWEIIDQHMSAPPPSLKENVPAIPPEVEKVILTALAKDPQQRFASVHAFTNALEQASRPEAPRPSVSTPVPPSVTSIANSDPKLPVTPIPVSSVPASSHPSLPTPPSTTPANRDTVQFSSLAATSMPSTSRVGDDQNAPLRPSTRDSFTSPDSMIAPKPVIQASQQKRGRLVYPTLTTALQFVVHLWRQKLHLTLATVPQLVVKAPQGGRGRPVYTTVTLLVLLLIGITGTGAYYVVGVEPYQPIRALITQANREVTSDPARALGDLAAAQRMLQAVPGNPLTDAQRTEVTQKMAYAVEQAIHNYNQRAAITALCPANAPAATINDGSTGTHAQLLAVTQAATGSSLLYALGQNEKLYQLKQLNGLNSLANPVISNLQVQDIAGDNALLVVLLKESATNYFLDLFVPGKAGQLQFADLANISPVSGESPMLVTGYGSDVYVLLVSSPSATTTHAQIIDFTVSPNNTFYPSPPTRTSFSLAGTIVSVAAFPNHVLFLLLADGSVVSLQAGMLAASIPTPVLVPAPIVPPLADSGAAFTATLPVPTLSGSAAVTSTGPVPLSHLQVSIRAPLRSADATDSLSVAVVGGVPHLYLADTASRRVLDLSGGPTAVAGTSSRGGKSLLFQMVQQYASSSLLAQMKGIAVDANGMVIYVLTQNSPTVTSLVSIKLNGQTASSCE